MCSRESTFRDRTHLAAVSAEQVPLNRFRAGLKLTHNHHIEVETLADTLTVPLVGQVGKTNVAGQLPANDILHIRSSLSNSLGVLGAHGLSVSRAHWVTALNEGRTGLAAGGRGRNGRAIGNRCRGWCSYIVRSRVSNWFIILSFTFGRQAIEGRRKRMALRSL